MTSRRVNFPIFDSDNHLYETRDALTKYLPESQQGAIDYVDVHGRTKIVVRGQISDYIPNPTFDRVGRPGPRRSTSSRGTRTGSHSGRSSGAASTARRGSVRPRLGSRSWTSKASTTR